VPIAWGGGAGRNTLRGGDNLSRKGGDRTTGKGGRLTGKEGTRCRNKVSRRANRGDWDLGDVGLEAKRHCGDEGTMKRGRRKGGHREGSVGGVGEKRLRTNGLLTGHKKVERRKGKRRVRSG